jgi:polar amino acid transport system substrate-binding protein
VDRPQPRPRPRGLRAGAAHAADKFDFSPEQQGRPRAAKDAEAVNAIPPSFKFVKEGVLTVAMAPFARPSPPTRPTRRPWWASTPTSRLLIADTLGLKLDLQPIAWADWPLGLSSGKYDAVISNVGVTEQRKEKFDFSTYRLGLHGFYVKADSPIRSIKEPKDIAGLKLTTGAGTNQERILLEWNRQNVAAGLKPATIQYYDDDVTRTLAVVTKRVDANFNPNAPQAYEAAKNGQIRLVGTVNAGWPLKSDVAVATRKGSGLAVALTAAANSLIRNGTYGKALARWSLAEEALPRSRPIPRACRSSRREHRPSRLSDAGQLRRADRSPAWKPRCAVRIRREAGLRRRLGAAAAPGARRVVGRDLPGRRHAAHAAHRAGRRRDPDGVREPVSPRRRPGHRRRAVARPAAGGPERGRAAAWRAAGQPLLRRGAEHHRLHAQARGAAQGQPGRHAAGRRGHLRRIGRRARASARAAHAPGLVDRLWYGGGSLRSAEWAGRNGFNLLLGNVLSGETPTTSCNAQLGLIERYRLSEDARAGPGGAGPRDRAAGRRRCGHAQALPRVRGRPRRAHAGTPQGERRTLFANDLVGTSDEILERCARTRCCRR